MIKWQLFGTILLYFGESCELAIFPLFLAACRLPFAFQKARYG
nr:MAG TPA: hypothetical protein [Caudoviricetes sp.]